jgi:hypothetical protein
VIEGWEGRWLFDGEYLPDNKLGWSIYLILCDGRSQEGKDEEEEGKLEISFHG